MKRDYFYQLTTRGELLLDGYVQDDPWFVDFFFRRLATNANPDVVGYRYVSRCGDEMNYLAPQDTPIVFTGYDGYRLLYGATLSVLFDPTKLLFSQEGVLYHAAPIGGLGRIAANVAVELAASIVPWGRYYAFTQTEAPYIVPFLGSELLATHSVMRPQKQNGCIGCGLQHPHSLMLSFVVEHSTNIITTYVTPNEAMQGAMGSAHGGMISLLLDEVMGKQLSVRGIKAPTARLEVDFRQPLSFGNQVQVQSAYNNGSGRKHWVNATITEVQSGVCLAEGKALFIERRT
jgi:acyl-coenzyme A thioesterase PaaI-like protein